MTEDNPVNLKPWPGPLSPDTNFRNYVMSAFGGIDKAWDWDSPERRAFCLSSFNLDQVALWAIWNVGSPADNGGLFQVLYNPDGELVGEAIAGFRRFQMNDYAEIVEEGASRFVALPVPISRKERLRSLEMATGIAIDDSDRKRLMAAFKKGREMTNDLAERARELRERDGFFLKLLSYRIEDRKDTFFVMSAGSLGTGAG